MKKLNFKCYISGKALSYRISAPAPLLKEEIELQRFMRGVRNTIQAKINFGDAVRTGPGLAHRV